jgi:hypothetical protein
VPGPGFVWTNAVTVERPADQVWPWVNQLGQGRGGLYSYDWLENLIAADVHSLAEIRSELQRDLAVGERVIRMTRYAPHNPVARYDNGRALVLGGVADSEAQLREGRPSSSWAFIVQPVDVTASRLIVRSRAAGFAARLQGPIQFVMQRKMTLGIKQRAEGTWALSVGDVLVPLSWFAGAAATAVLGARAIGDGERQLVSAAAAGCAAVGAEVLLFWDLSARRRAALVLAMAASATHAWRRV